MRAVLPGMLRGLPLKMRPVPPIRPIKAHSFHEIMVSARANGVPYADGEYAPIAPLTQTELDKIGPVPER